MMMRSLIVIALIGVFVAPRLVLAEYRIAVVEPNRVVEQSPQYEAAGKALEAELSKREKALRAQTEEIAALKGKVESSEALMSEAELRRLENDIRSRSRRLKYAQDEFQDDFSLRQNELRTKLAQQVQEVVEELAREQEIDLIVSEGIVYFSERIDISDQVIDRLKQKFNAMQ